MIDDSAASTGASGIGVCLGASFLGFYAHAGFLQGLVEGGVRPAHVAGCSSGAVVGGLYAAGLPPGRIVEDLMSLDFIRTFFEPAIPLRGMAMLVNLPRVSGLLKGGSFRRHLRGLVGDRRIEDCRAPRLSVAVTNLSTAASEILVRGPLVDAMSASAAVPVLFNAVEVEGRYFWDGGITNFVPVDALCSDGTIHTVIAHRIIRDGERDPLRRGGRPSIATACNVAHQAIGNHIFDVACAKIVASGRRFILCETHSSMPPIGRRRRERYVELGRATALAHLPQIAAPRP